MQRGIQPSLESQRLKLRPYALTDSKDVKRLAGDIRVAGETMNIPHPYELGLAEEWISSLDEKWRNRETVEFAIIVKDDSELIGGMSFVKIDGDEAEIGYWLGVPYWNNGYCTEAGKLLVDYGRNDLSLRKITARHLSTNPMSGKVLKKLGLIWIKSEYRNDRYGNKVKFECYETPSD